MDSTVLTTSLHGLRGMGLILNLRYPQPARRGGCTLHNTLAQHRLVKLQAIL